MKVTRAIAVYILATVALSALLAPWAFRAARELGQHAPFRRVFDRTLLVVAVIGLWPLSRTLGIRSCGEIGYPQTRGWWKQVALGVVLGVGSFAAAGGLLLLLGARKMDPNVGVAAFFARLPGFVGAAIAVAVIEETYFRGGLQGALQRGMKPFAAIAVASAIYSVVHFLKPPAVDVAAEVVRWSSGFDYLARVFAQCWRGHEVGLGVVTLWLVGSILGLAFVRTKALYVSIGLHGGWVLTLKSYSLCTQAKLPQAASWWGGSALTGNALVWPILILLLAIVNWICCRNLDSRR